MEQSDRLAELVLQSPRLDCDYFHVQKEGKGFQRWRAELIDGTELEVYLDQEQRWQSGVIDSWVIDDGSGNAPAIDRHFFLTWKGFGIDQASDFLNDDLQDVNLSSSLVASPPIELWPSVVRRIAVPPDVDDVLLGTLHE